MQVRNQALTATALSKVDAAALQHTHDEAIFALADVVTRRFNSTCPHHARIVYTFNLDTGVDRATYWALAGRMCPQCADQLSEDGEIFVVLPDSGVPCLVGRGSRTDGELHCVRVIDDEPWQTRQLKLALLLAQAEEMRQRTRSGRRRRL